MPMSGASTLRRSTMAMRSDRSIGILVHRLLQRADVHRRAERRAASADWPGPCSTLPLWLSLTIRMPLSTGDRASFRQISSRAEVRDLYRSGHPYHEVPFTMAVAGRIVRGTIDCLIASPDRVTVLEFKTGRPQPEHQAQAEVYRAAAEALFPGRSGRKPARVYVGFGRRVNADCPLLHRKYAVSWSDAPRSQRSVQFCIAPAGLLP